jgi:two-component system, NtrC family, response regulator GlrR
VDHGISHTVKSVTVDQRTGGAAATFARARQSVSSLPLVGNAHVFREAIAPIPVIARSARPVLIGGETGTGKELVARAIHAGSDRANFPFVAVNCGSLVDTLVDDALFGHEPGAFTDARVRREGFIARAGGGTLFLDELEALSTKGQVTLLRVLEDDAFRALGSSRLEHANVRFVAATNAPLEGAIRAGMFRADLYYRLCVFSINLPPLRERPEDVLTLAHHFLLQHAPSDGPLPELDETARRALAAYPWPGNVRELENTIIRAIYLRKAAAISAADLGLSIDLRLAAAPPGRTFHALKQETIATFERRYLERVMHEHRGNVTHAALATGKERRELGRLLKKHRIDPQSFRRL